MWRGDEGRTVSYWEANGDAPQTDSLNASVETDVCIVGGGIAGLTTAYFLARSGRKVFVIDDGVIGGGETARTTAHLTNAIDDRIYRIAEWHGEDKARLAVGAHTRAIDTIERIAAEEEIDCDFARIDGYLFRAAENDSDDLDKEYYAAGRIMEIERVERAPLKGFDTGPALKFPFQGQFHVLKYLRGLARAVERAGGRLFSGTRVIEWQGGDSPVVKTAGGQAVAARSVVLATNYPIMSKMFTKLPAYRTFVIGAGVPKGAVEKALYWDTADPYHYVRIHEEDGRDVLIVGGEDHRTGQENDGEERFRRLWQWTKERFPAADEVLYRWSGQILETNDGLAFIGRYSESEPNVYLITGDSGMGMTHGTIGGMLVSDLILGLENPWAAVFDPSRVATQSISEALPEIIGSTVPYADWITAGDVSSVEEVKNGTGAIISDGTTKIAAYRDDDGRLYTRSAVCRHLGCLVRFNTLEKTWDCPCHGSRYGVDGHPINTPAHDPLEEAGGSVS